MCRADIPVRQLSNATKVNFGSRISVRRLILGRAKVKGSGQECPLYIFNKATVLSQRGLCFMLLYPTLPPLSVPRRRYKPQRLFSRLSRPWRRSNSS